MPPPTHTHTRPHTRLPAALLVCLLAAGAAPAAPTPTTLAVAAPVEPYRWLVDSLAGDRATALPVVRPGESPETFSPSDARISLLTRSDLYLAIGAPFENAPWMRTIARAGRVEFIDARPPPESEPEAPPHDHHAPHDHHTWLSPVQLGRQARALAAALARVDPEHAPEYGANLERTLEELDRLDAQIRAALAPMKERIFFVDHPAWESFASDYGLDQRAVEVDGKPPTDAQISAFLRDMRRAGATTLFVNPSAASRTARTVARAAGARVEPLDPLAADLPANLLRAARRIAGAAP